MGRRRVSVAGRSDTARGRRADVWAMRLMGLLLSYSLIRADVGRRDLDVTIGHAYQLVKGLTSQARGRSIDDKRGCGNI